MNFSVTICFVDQYYVFFALQSATFLEPVTIQLPVSLGNKVVNLPQASDCRVRILFLNSERETKEWVEISDKLEIPASYDGDTC